MSEADRRLECLKLALQRAGANDARPWREIADEFTAWVEGQADKAPASPSDEAAGKPTGRQARGSAARQ